MARKKVILFYLRQGILITLITLSSILIILKKLLWFRTIDIFVNLGPQYFEFLAVIFFVILFAYSLYLLNKYRKFYNLVPVIILVLALIVLIVVPHPPNINVYFELNKTAMKEVVSLVEEGTLKPNVSYNESLIRLPIQYRKLSRGGGEIWILQNNNHYIILFFTFRGIRDNFAGYLFSSNNSLPEEGILVGELVQYLQLENNWYWVSYR